MGSIQILLGKTRTRRRAALRRDQLAGNDRFGRPNFLYLTDTVRKERLVQAEYLRYREGASFVPDVATVSALVEEAVLRFGDGRGLWPAGALALRIEARLDREPERFPWLAGLGNREVVAAELEALLRAWDEAGRPALDGPRGPERTRFLGAVAEELAEAAWALPGEAIRAVVPTLAAPSPALAAWLTRHPAVIVDDVLHPSPARMELLVALARAWRALGVHVVFAFESGRDLGGAEAGRFFEYDDDDAVAFSLRPFAASREWRRALFGRLVAEGGEADVGVVGADASVRAVDIGEIAAAVEPPDLADALYVTPDAPVAAGALRLVRHPDPESEVRAIAAEVKERLLAGDRPEDLWVAMPGLPAYAPLIRRWFGRMGIPFDLSTGEPLAAHPVAALLRDAACLPGLGWPVERLLGLAGSPLVGALAPREAARLGRACREAGVRAGHPRTWADRLPEDRREALEPLVALADQLLELHGPRRPDAWRDQLVALVGRWDMPRRIRDGHPPEAAPALAALGAALAAAEAVARAFGAAEAGPVEGGRLGRALERALADRRLGEPGVGIGAVQVVGMLELRGIHPPRLWIGGLVADDFPPLATDTWLVARDERRTLGLVEPGDEARYLFASALRNAQADGHALTLSWPATRDERPMAPSPVVEDLLRVRVGTGTLAERVEAGCPPAIPLGAFDLERLLGEAEAAGLAVDAWAPHADDPAGLDALRVGVAQRLDEAAFHARDGVLPRPPAPPARLSPTALETYLACPARYFHQRVLGLDPEEPFEADLPVADRGSLLHAVLAAFVAATRDDGGPPPWESDEARMAELRRRLHALAEAALAADPAFAALPSALAAEHRRRWLSGLADEGPEGVFAAWLRVEAASGWGRRYDAVEAATPPMVLAGVPVEGRVDRVDRLADGAPLVIDYKSGSPPPVAAMAAGVRVQSLLYLEALAGGGPLGAAAYLRVGKADAVAYESWAGAPEALAVVEAGRRSFPVDEATRAELRRHLERAVERLAAGVFHPTLAGPDLAGCAHCPYRTACRVDHARAERIAARGDDRWQAPRTVEEA